MSPQKTIAIIAPYYPPYGGGLERYAYEIATRLQKDHQWRVVIVTSGKRYGKDSKEVTNGVTIYRLSYRWRFSNTPVALNWFGKMRRIFKDEKPNILNIHAPVPGIGNVAALVARHIPIVVTYHTGSMNKLRLVPDVFIWLYEYGALPFLLLRANFIICASDFVRFNFLKRYLYKSVTVTPGVDSEYFKPNIARKSKDPTVLFVAGLGIAEQHKGLADLLRAIKFAQTTIPNIKLMVVGDGDMRKEYEQQAKDLGLMDVVSFSGRLNGQALVAKYQEAHIFALPSSNDNLSMAILEAMSSGLPVLSTRVGGIPTLVNDGETGMLVTPKDIDALSEKLINLLHDQKHSAMFGERARIKTERQFGWSVRTEQSNEILNRFIDQNEPHIQRLLVVAPYFYPKIGGLEKYAYNIAKRLNQSGAYRVSIATSNYDGDGYRQDVIDGMIVHRLPIWGKILNTPVNPMWYWWLKRIFAADQPDIVNAHTPVPFIADMAERARGSIPYVITYHNDIIKDTPWPKFFSKLAHRFLIDKTLRNSDGIITTSKYYAENSVYLRPYQNKLRVVSPGVDLNVFNPTVSGKEIAAQYDGKRIILFVGNLNKSQEHKGLRDLITAFGLLFPKHRDVQLIVVGSGDGKKGYEELAKKTRNGTGIAFVGQISEKKLPEYFAAAYVEVMPSTNTSEGFGMAIIEASACGKPTIGTNVGGIPYAMEDGVTGFLVPPKKPEMLSEAIARLLDDRPLAERLGRAGAERTAALFNWEKIEEQTNMILSQT